MSKKLARIIVTRCFVGICHMQVCTEADATDEEILEVCNRENPAGTTRGWCDVIRKNGETGSMEENMGPRSCQKYPGRIHIMVSC